MNIPFPILYPRLVDPSWFNADSPCDEDAELTSMEQAHQQWVNAIFRKFYFLISTVLTRKNIL